MGNISVGPNVLDPEHFRVIGPTHGDITADCVAKVYAPIDSGPRTLVILHKWMKTTGAEMNEARLRMRRIPKDAELVNKISGASGFWIGDIIVMAGVPSIMQAMLYEVAPKPKIGVRMISETVRAHAREGDIGMQLGEIVKANPAVAIGSYPFFDPQHGPNTNVVLRPQCREARKPNVQLRARWSECGEHKRIPPEPRIARRLCTSENANYGDLPSHTDRRLHVNTIIAERPATSSIH